MRDDERKERARAFSTGSEVYDRVRPGYPDDLYRRVLEFVKPLPEGGVLEIGAGTGIATGPFLRLDREIIALEPTSELAEQAREKYHGDAVSVVESSFEDCEFEAESFSLIYAATAFHWIDQKLALPKSVELLTEGGTLAVFDSRHPRPFTGFFDDVQQVYRRVVPEWGHPDESETTSDYMATVQDTLLECKDFSRVERHEYSWSKEYTAADYADLMRTASDHILLGEERLERLIGGLVEIMEDRYGGSVERPFKTVLTMGKK